MTQPSAVLDAIVARLSTALAPRPNTSDVRIHVAAIDDTVLADVTEYHTVPLPAVLVTCLSMTNVARDYGPTTVNGQFVARCISRLPARPTGATVTLSRGDVAMDLAAIIEALVDVEDWQGAALSRATRIGARNVGSRELSQRGLSMWLVSWEQQFEVSPRDVTTLLHAFRKLNIALELDGGTSPDAAGALALEGREP